MINTVKPVNKCHETYPGVVKALKFLITQWNYALLKVKDLPFRFRIKLD